MVGKTPPDGQGSHRGGSWALPSRLAPAGGGPARRRRGVRRRAGPTTSATTEPTGSGPPTAVPNRPPLLSGPVLPTPCIGPGGPDEARHEAGPPGLGPARASRRAAAGRRRQDGPRTAAGPPAAECCQWAAPWPLYQGRADDPQPPWGRGRGGLGGRARSSLPPTEIDVALLSRTPVPAAEGGSGGDQPPAPPPPGVAGPSRPARPVGPRGLGRGPRSRRTPASGVARRQGR